MTSVAEDAPAVLIRERTRTGCLYAKIVYHHVVEDGIEWYRRRKRRRRRAHYAIDTGGALAGLALLTAAVIAASESGQPQLQVPTGASGVLITALTYLWDRADLRRTWALWTTAQEELQHHVSEWELAMVHADIAGPTERERWLKGQATEAVLARSRAVRATEREAYFGRQAENGNRYGMLTAT